MQPLSSQESGSSVGSSPQSGNGEGKKEAQLKITIRKPIHHFPWIRLYPAPPIATGTGRLFPQRPITATAK